MPVDVIVGNPSLPAYGGFASVSAVGGTGDGTGGAGDGTGSTGAASAGAGAGAGATFTSCSPRW